MATDPILSILDSQGLLDSWTGFLTHDSNKFNSTATPNATNPSSSRLQTKISRLWDLQFDSTAALGGFTVAETAASRYSQSLLLPLSQSWTTSPKIGEILDKFEVAKDGSIPGDDGTVAAPIGTGGGTAGGLPSPSGLVDSVVQAIKQSNPNQLFKPAAGERNAVWLTPGQTLRSDVALTLEFDGTTAPLSILLNAIEDHFGLSVPGIGSPADGVQILLHRTCLGVETIKNGTRTWDVTTTFRLTFRIDVGTFAFWITQEPSGMSFHVTGGSGPSGGLSSLSSSIGAVLSFFTTGIFSTIKIVQLSMGKGKPSPTSPNASSEVWWRLILALQFSSSTAVYLEYDSDSDTFSGGFIQGELLRPPEEKLVLIKGFYATDEDKLLPSYQAGKDFGPPDGSPPPKYKVARLSDISSAFASLPKALPTAAAFANLAYDHLNATFWISAKLIQSVQSTPGDPVDGRPPMPFTWDVLDLYCRISGSSVDAANLSTHFTLRDDPALASPDPTVPARTAELALNFNYDQGNWRLRGQVTNLRLSMLSQFFAPNAKQSLKQMLGKIEVAELGLEYIYDHDNASSFTFKGKVDIGDLELDILYTNNGTDWEFKISGGAKEGNAATLGSVIDSIVDGAADDLPSFVSHISIPPAAAADSPIVLTVKSHPTNVVFAFRITIDRVNLSFVQLGSLTGPGAPGGAGSPAKRILRFSVDKIPIIPNVPLLNLLPQPFDELEYMWVSEEGSGWQASEVELVNRDVLRAVNDQLSYKVVRDPNAPAPAGGRADVVLASGHHFVVLRKRDVVLDHNFSATGTAPSGPASGGGQDGGEGDVDGEGGPTALVIRRQRGRRVLLARGARDDNAAAGPSPPASTPTKGALDFSYGPLTVTAVTLHYKEEGDSKVLALTMDATFKFEPITFSLLGFGFGLNLSTVNLDHLSSLASSLVVELAGLSFSFDNPPMLIAGGFEHEIVTGGEIYKGGVGVSFPPYTFVGVGEYAIFRDYKSVFLYAKLDGPLITLGFATISGVRLGVGFNSSVRTPNIDQITSFPFVNDHSVSGAGNDPMKILKAMVDDTSSGSAWVTPQNNSYWFAAGLTLIAFDILTVTAVAMVQFKPEGLIISIIADAVAQMPPSVTSRSEMIAYVELGFIAEMNMVDGYFRVEAALAPTSFLLVPQCRIYGGMALVYWFSPNEHSGDWVFTVGGYHRKFQVPAWYPPVQRLGISFQVGPLSVTGETYFAITPKVAMGGAMIHVTLSVGPVSAWLDAGFDVLVNFHPLHYLAEFHIAVGVSFDADVWFVHIHISATVGAWLEVQGPSFGGTAHVDFCMFAFDVDFGASPETPPAMSLIDFWKMLHKPGPNVQSQNQNDPNPPTSFLSYVKDTRDAQDVGAKSHEEGAAIKFALEDGNIPQASKDSANGNPTSTGAGSKWFVKGGTFKFRVLTDFAISKATVTNVLPVVEAPSDAPIYSKPMHVTTPIISELVVTVKAGTSIEGRWSSILPDMKLMPLAAFGKYDFNTDPSNKNADQKELLNGKDGTIKLLMGLIVSAPFPFLDKNPMGVFDATMIQSMAVQDIRPGHDPEWLLPASELAQKKYLPAPMTAEETDDDYEVRWKFIRETWSGLRSNQGVVNDENDGVLAQCHEIFGWKKNRPQVELAATAAVSPAPAPTPAPGNPAPVPTPAPGDPTPTTAPAPVPVPGPDAKAYQPWRLVGPMPTKLINKLEEHYLDLPRIAVVV